MDEGLSRHLNRVSDQLENIDRKLDVGLTGVHEKINGLKDSINARDIRIEHRMTEIEGATNRKSVIASAVGVAVAVLGALLHPGK